MRGYLRIIRDHRYYSSGYTLEFRWYWIWNDELTSCKAQIWLSIWSVTQESKTERGVIVPGPNIATTRLGNVRAQYEPFPWVNAANRIPTKKAVIDARKIRSPEKRVMSEGTNRAASTPTKISLFRRIVIPVGAIGANWAATCKALLFPLIWRILIESMIILSKGRHTHKLTV